MYHALSYEPVLEDSADYDHHIHPNFYRIGAEKVTFWIGDEVEKAVKARLTKEMEAFLKILEQMGAPFTMLYKVETEAQDPVLCAANTCHVQRKVEGNTDKSQNHDDSFSTARSPRSRNRIHYCRNRNCRGHRKR